MTHAVYTDAMDPPTLFDRHAGLEARRKDSSFTDSSPKPTFRACVVCLTVARVCVSVAGTLYIPAPAGAVVQVRLCQVPRPIRGPRP